MRGIGVMERRKVMVRIYHSALKEYDKYSKSNGTVSELMYVKGKVDIICGMIEKYDNCMKLRKENNNLWNSDMAQYWKGIEDCIYKMVCSLGE